MKLIKLIRHPEEQDLNLTFWVSLLMSALSFQTFADGET